MRIASKNGVRVVALDRLDRRVGRDLHVRRAKERRARVAARDRHDGRHHQVLDKGTRDDNLERHPLARRHRRLDGGNRRREATLAVCREAVEEGLRPGPLRAARRAVEHPLHRRGRHGVHARRVERILERDVHVAVRLLVIHDNVHVRRRQRLRLVKDARRRHAVEFAHLRRALQHLHRVGIVRHLVLRTRGRRVRTGVGERQKTGKLRTGDEEKTPRPR